MLYAKFFFVNALTFGRIPLILVFLVISLVLGAKNNSLLFAIAFGAMVLSTLSDAFDGYYARKFNMTTRLGAYADPLTDKIFYLTTFPTLVFLACLDPDQQIHARLLLGLTIVFLMRDQWVSFLRSIGALHNIDAQANWSGKARTIISFPTICVVYWYLKSPWFPHFPLWLVYVVEMISLAINLISIWVYTRNYWPALRIEFKTPFGKGDAT